jgi:hypothetical protein
MEHEEEHHRLTRDTSTDVDAGRVIDHRVVQAWADSLDDENPRPEPLW